MYVQIIIFIIFILACCTVFWNYKEHFWFIPQGISICDNVGGLNRHECKRCTNAGYCTMPNGMSHCVNGDFNGPYNGEDCVEYEYGNSYANLSLIDPHQPYWADTHRRWDWNSHIKHKYNRPIPISEGAQYFHHSSPPKQHHKKFN